MRDFSNPRFEGHFVQKPVGQRRIDLLREKYDDVRKQRLAQEDAQRLRAPFLAISQVLSGAVRALSKQSAEDRLAVREPK